MWPFNRVYYGWAIVTVAVSAAFALGPSFSPVLAVFVRPIEQELGWSRATISFAFTLGSFISSLLTLLVGRLLDRYGARGIMVISGMAVTAAFLGMAVMTHPWHFWALFAVARPATSAGIQLSTMIAIASWFVQKRGRAMGFRVSGQRAGQAVQPLIAYAIMAVANWRWSMTAMAGMSFLFMVVPSALWMRRRPEDMGLLPDGRSPEGLGEVGSPQPGPSEDSWTLREAMRTRALWLLVLTVCLGFFITTGIGVHIIANFQDRGISAAAAVGVASLVALISMVTAVGWGFLLERVHVRYGVIVTGLFLLVSVAAVMLVHTVGWAMVVAVLLGIATGGWNTSQGVLFANYFGRRSAGTIRSVAAPFSAVVTPLGPLLAGYSFDVTGSYQLAFTVFGGAALVMIMAMLVAVPPRRHAP